MSFGASSTRVHRSPTFLTQPTILHWRTSPFGVVRHVFDSFTVLITLPHRSSPYPPQTAHTTTCKFTLDISITNTNPFDPTGHLTSTNDTVWCRSARLQVLFIVPPVPTPTNCVTLTNGTFRCRSALLRHVCIVLQRSYPNRLCYIDERHRLVSFGASSTRLRSC